MESHHMSKISETVGSIDDLLIQILLRLPIKSLLRLKSISHHWLSLISDPKFCHLRNPKPNRALGLIWNNPCGRKAATYVPFNAKNTKKPTGIILPRIGPFRSVLSSCNGLLICRTSRAHEQSKPRYYVYNPTTNQYSALDLDDWQEKYFLYGITIAFDPVKSPYYKVVCAGILEKHPDHRQVIIFSSKTRAWSIANVDNLSNIALDDWQKGVYWNGAIHWFFRMERQFFYFNIDDNVFEEMPSPPTPAGLYRDLRGNHYDYYFGESCDRLHYIELLHSLEMPNMERTTVYEMKRDYSEWFVKYRIDLSEVFQATSTYTGFCLLYFVVGEEDKDSFLVLSRSGKVIRYNLVSKSFKKLYEFPRGWHPYNLSRRFQYIESLCGFSN